MAAHDRSEPDWRSARRSRLLPAKAPQVNEDASNRTHHPFQKSPLSRLSPHAFARRLVLPHRQSDQWLLLPEKALRDKGRYLSSSRSCRIRPGGKPHRNTIAHNRGKLRNPSRRNYGVITKDSPEIVFVRENFILHWQEHACGINQVNNGKRAFKCDSL